VTEPTTIWQTLGIAATSDVAIIRKAYASRLKECHPEEDAAGFQRLRAAYEAALQAARGAIAAARPERPTGVASATDTPPPVIAIASPEAEADHKRFEAALGHLQQLLKAPGDVDSEALERALDAVLNNPGAFHVGNWSGLDRRLAGLLLESVPRSDVLATTVVERLGWNHTDVAARRAQEVIAVVTRVADLAIVAKLRVGTDPDARAFQLLSQPAPTSWLVRRVKVFFVDQAVRDFLQKTLPARPTLALWLNKASTDTWMRIFGRPYLTRRTLLAMPIYSAVALMGTLIAADNGAIAQHSSGIALLLALFAGPVLGLLKVYAFSWPILLTLRRLKGKVLPLWARVGWLPASVTSVVLVSVAGTGWPVVLLALVLSGVLLVWASVAAYPVFIAEGLDFSQKLLLSLSRNRLLLVWIGIVIWAVGLPAGIATTGAWGASEIAGIGIAKIWLLDVAPRVRHWCIVALAIIVGTALVALWSGHESPRQIGFGTALVTGTVLLQRPTLSALRSRLDQLWIIGIFPVYVFATLFANANTHSALTARLAAQLAGSYLLTGPAFLMIAYIFREVSPRLQKAILNRARDSADRPVGSLPRFFDRESPVLPVIIGLALLGSGGYGLLVLSNYTGPDWMLYGALAGAGLYVLKRTFAAPT
jgi:hypothetical protein